MTKLATRPQSAALEPTASDKNIARVCRDIDRAEHAYRVGKPIMSDAEFDRRMDWLRRVDPTNPRIKRVGAAKETASSRRTKEKLPIVIGSLDKLRPADVAAWMNEIGKLQPQQHWLVEPKFDGQSITLRYQKKDLERAWSRGRDGITGQNVLAAARHVQGVRAVLKDTKLFDVGTELLVRGEVIMHRSLFKEHYEGQKSALGREYVTARNLVCGLTNRIDPEGVVQDLRRCTFVALQLFKKDGHGNWKRPSSAHREWVYLQLLGFTTALHPARYSPGHSKLARLVGDGHECLKKLLPVHEHTGSVGHLAYWDHIPTEAEVKERFTDMQKAVDIRIDGLVVQPVDNKYWQNKKDHLSPRPSFVKSIKLEAHEQETMDTKVGEIEWNVSKRGLLKPRLIMADPVIADGVEVNHSTCNNARFVADWGLRPGRPIRVVRSGDVIPRIVGVFSGGKWVRLDTKADGIKDPKALASLPKRCPSCNTPVKWNANKVDLLCPNEKCPGRHGKAVLAFFRTLGVEDVAKGVVEHLIAEGYSTVPKILDGATAANLVKLEGYQAKKAATVSKAIAGAMEDKPLATVMHASGCFQNDTFSLGSSRLTDIVGHVGVGMLERGTKGELRAKLATLKGLGASGTDLFLDAVPEWRRFYASIRKHHRVKVGPATMKDVVAAFTGFRDERLAALIQKHGGRVAGMSKKITILFAASLGSTKCKRADQYGIPIVAQADAEKWVLAKARA